MGEAPNGNGSPWWAKTWQRSIENVGPLIVGFFALLGIVVFGAYYILTHPATEAQAQTSDIKNYIKDSMDNIRAEVLASRSEMVNSLNRMVEGQRQTCKLIAVNHRQQEAYCNF